MPPEQLPWWQRLTADAAGLEPPQEHVIGMDEVGTGALAGPYVVCGVYAPFSWNLKGLKDSKKLSEAERERLVGLLVRDSNIRIGLWSTPSSVVDMGPREALLHSYEGARAQLPETATLIIDGMPLLRGAIAAPKADTFVPVVMAASILAKVHRDHIMMHLDREYPAYNFKKHKGYGTPEHQQALRASGLSPVHRVSYLRKDAC